MKVGDKVKITDGSWAVRVDKYEPYTSIGLSKDVWEVIRITCDQFLRCTADKQMPIHDVFIKNTKTGMICLHSTTFIKPTDNSF